MIRYRLFLSMNQPSDFDTDDLDAFLVDNNPATLLP